MIVDTWFSKLGYPLVEKWRCREEMENIPWWLPWSAQVKNLNVITKSAKNIYKDGGGRAATHTRQKEMREVTPGEGNKAHE